jgi:hypothetical protein
MKRITIYLSTSSKPSGAGRYAQTRTATPTEIDPDLKDVEEFEKDMLEKREEEYAEERAKKLREKKKEKKKKSDDGDEDASDTDEEDVEEDAEVKIMKKKA